MIFLSLLMAAGLTGASTVLIDKTFNFAIIIIIPLLFGLGVDGGIYIIHRLLTLSARMKVYYVPVWLGAWFLAV